MQPPLLLPGARPIQLRGSAVARFILRCFGWRVEFEGLPALQGVVMVYPHTSNWDFVVGILAKWAIGIPVKFWAKASLFKPPLLGPWVRWVGGVPIDRSSSKGMVGDTVAQIAEARRNEQFYWLAVAPEGTRSLTTGWRSGAYHVALEAHVPVALAALDFGRKSVRFKEFVMPGGEPQADFAMFEKALGGPLARRPELAGPITLRK